MSPEILTIEKEISAYTKSVINGRAGAGKLEKLAVKRYLSDLERVGTKAFPYVFDKDKAVRPISFVEQLKHTKGEWANRGEKIKLEPWQKFIYWNVCGWVKADGSRRFSKAYVEIARKNGKTTFGAGLMNYFFHADGEEGPEIYFVATKKDQARIAYDEAERQNLKHPTLKRRVKAYKQHHTVVVPGTAAKMRPLGKDSNTEDGLNPHAALVDEYHEHKTPELLNVVESGMGAREQPMIFIITTAGFDRNKPCYQEERTLAVNILEGVITPRPENFFGIIFTLDEGDDWTNPKVWRKANPNLGISVSREFLADQVTQALASPLKANNVITKCFNTWTQAETRWINPNRWAACGEYPINEDTLVGRRCYCGLDLSTTIDLSAWVLVFPPELPGEPSQALYRFFLPEENITDREKRDQVPYSYWADQGLITLTPGDVIDYDYIEAQIKEDAERFRIQEIAYDPYNATEIINHVTEDGLSVVPFRQGFVSMSPASKDFEMRVLKKQLAHGGNPIMVWMMACTEVATDPAGNIKPVKPDRRKSGKRIDGVVAHIMANWRAVVGEESGASVYNDRGVLAI